MRLSLSGSLSIVNPGTTEDAKMTLRKRIVFVLREYRYLIPAIWRSWRSPAYPPPTREEVLEFMEKGVDGGPVDLTPTCTGSPGPVIQRRLKMEKERLNGY
jgi:hypothetical protein